MSEKGGDCLVARAVPCNFDDVDSISGRIDQLSLDESKKQNKASTNITPSDFVCLQSIRSSALARKTNTASKFFRGGPSLLTDLLNKDEQPITMPKRTCAMPDVGERKQQLFEGKKDDLEVEKKEAASEEKTEQADQKEEKKNTSQDEETKSEAATDLLSRGPVRNYHPPMSHHPYHHPGIHYGTAAQSVVHDYSAFSNYGSGYECGSTWTDSPDTIGYSSSTCSPATVTSDHGYISSSPTQPTPPSQSLSSPSFCDNLPPEGRKLSRLLDSTALPEALVDFILKFSESYKERTPCYSETSPKTRPPSADCGLNSPMSARSAPNASPEVPTGGQSGPTTPSLNQSRYSPRKTVDRIAKARLRAILDEEEFTQAWAWTLICLQHAPMCLVYQDADLDTVLHIVIGHNDLARTYAVVEQQLKCDKLPKDPKPFDLPNRYGETPLFIAVMHRQLEVVEYLLELGADVRIQNNRSDKDTMLHYAAARGMTEIVKILISQPGIYINKPNGRGETPLLTAIRHHGVYDEVTSSTIDSKDTVVLLLRAGANPSITDTSNGRTIIHYAIDRMDPQLLESIVCQIDGDVVTELCNKADYSNETPMLQMQNPECMRKPQELRRDVFLCLLTNGGRVTASPHPAL